MGQISSSPDGSVAAGELEPKFWTAPRAATNGHTRLARAPIGGGGAEEHDLHAIQGRRGRLFFQTNTMWGGGVSNDVRMSSAWLKNDEHLTVTTSSSAFASGKSQPRFGSDGRVPGKPLPRLLLNISNHRPKSAWSADHGRTASMILSGEARSNSAPDRPSGSQQQPRGGEMGGLDRSTKSHDDRLYSPGTFSSRESGVGEASAIYLAADNSGDFDDGQMKNAGTQCDLMSEVVLKFNKNTLLGAVELSRLDDILRRFAAVAHPLVGAESNSPQLDRMGSMPPSSGPFAAARLPSDSEASSTAQRSTLLGSYTLRNARTATGSSAAATATVYADSVAESSVGYQVSERGDALSRLSGALDWPDAAMRLRSYGGSAGGLEGYGARSPNSGETVAVGAGGEQSRHRQSDVPPVDYQLEAASTVAVPTVTATAAATQTRDTFETREQLLRSALTSRRGQAGERREAKSGSTIANEVEAVATTAADATARSLVSSEESSEKAMASWHERLVVGVGLGYRMPWKHAGEGSNIIIPRPRVLAETKSASTVTTEDSTSPENDDADVIDIRL